MKSSYLLLAMMAVLLVGCAAQQEGDPPPRFNVTLEPTQIAANLFTPPARVQPVALGAAAPYPSDTPTQTSSPTAAVEDLATAEATAESDATESPAETMEVTDATVEPQPTSNNEDLRNTANGNLLYVAAELDGDCFVAEDYIPFRLTAQNLSTEPMYLYTKGRWMISINNSLLGPELTSLVPAVREDFVRLEAQQTYIQEEEDLGAWVLSLGPDSGIPFTSTGIGLPAGEYWVTFAHENDQDGLQEQPDGTFLVPQAAWQGRSVAYEVRFRVVEDQSEC